MNFLQKIMDKLTQWTKFLLNHKVYLLIFVPIIAAVIVLLVLLGRANDPDLTEETTTAATTTEATTTESTSAQTSETTTSAIETVPGTLPSETTTAETTTETTTEELRNPDIPLMVEKTDILGINEKTDDGIVLMTGELQVPVFYNSSENPAIAAINQAVYDYVYQLRKDIVKECRPIAENDLTSETPSIPFNCSVSAEIKLSSDTAVSILFSEWVYTGGDTSSVYRHAVTYSLADGSVCELEDLFGSFAPDIVKMLRDKVSSSIAEAPDGFYPDYEGLIDFYPVENRWYLDEEDGLCIYYVPYELAGKDKDVLTYSIPLGELNNYLLFNPAYTSFAE